MELRALDALAFALGVVARAMWYALGAPGGWCLPRGDRARASWGGGANGLGLGTMRACGLFERVSVDAEATLGALLRARGSKAMAHVNGCALDAHLRRVEEELGMFGAPAIARLAGAAHSAYGSELYPGTLVRLRDRRVLREVLGDVGEMLVFVYGTASQRAWYRATLGETRPFVAVNFYTGERVEIQSGALVGIVTLMHAADIIAVLNPTRGALSTAVGFALHLMSVAAETLRAASKTSSDGKALQSLARTIEDVGLDEVTKRMAILSDSSATWRPEDVRDLRERAVARAVARLRSTRSDAIMVMRATGVLS